MNYKYENQTAEMLLKQLKSAQSADGLEVAVKQCIAAASHEHDPAIQKILLKVIISPIQSINDEFLSVCYLRSFISLCEFKQSKSIHSSNDDIN